MDVANRARFEGYFGEHFARVTRACALVLLEPSAAEDVAAESFARLWSKWGQIEDDDHAGGYVFKTAMRLCARRARMRRRERLGATPDRVGVDEIGRSLDRSELVGALAQLPVRARQAVVLRDWAGFETSDVSRMLGIRESTVRVHLARGRKALRKALTTQERER